MTTPAQIAHKKKPALPAFLAWQSGLIVFCVVVGIIAGLAFSDLAAHKDFSVEGTLADEGRLHFFAVLAGLTLTYMCLHPLVAFWRRGWRIKEEDVMSSLSPMAKYLYLTTFQRAECKIEEAPDLFWRMYKTRYGKGRLIIPIAALCVVTIPLMTLVAETGIAHLLLNQAKDKATTLVAIRTLQADHFVMLPAAAAAAIAGAYTWLVLAFINGAATANLPPGSVLTGAMRMAMAAPLGYAVAAFGKAGFGPPLAFAIGAFPLDQVQSYLRQLATKQLSLPDLVVDKDQVVVLDGIDNATADRLSQADIMTVAQLAYCDPVQVSMKTNINFDAVIDVQNQALLWNYLGVQSPKVRPFGLRGAIEAEKLWQDLQDPTNTNASAALTAMAASTGLDASGLRRSFEELAADNYTSFLTQIWNDKASAAKKARAATIPPLAAQEIPANNKMGQTMTSVTVSVACSAEDWDVFIDGKPWCDPDNTSTTRDIDPGQHFYSWHMVGKSSDTISISITPSGQQTKVVNGKMPAGEPPSTGDGGAFNV